MLLIITVAIILGNDAAFGFQFIAPDNKDWNDVIPKNYIVQEEIVGDLNKDGIADIVLLVKKKDEHNIVENSFGEMVDRNRRGIIIFFKKGNRLETVVQNLSCFASENEEGGVYFAPVLSLSINKGLLYVQYEHGRYGYWTYTFRFQNSKFECIGFDNIIARGPVIMEKQSYNFSTMKKQIVVNTNEDAQEEGEEIFTETWYKIKAGKRLSLNEIKDFDAIDCSIW